MISNPHNILFESTQRLGSGFEKDRVNPGVPLGQIGVTRSFY
jgi:hypothetical protein